MGAETKAATREQRKERKSVGRRIAKTLGIGALCLAVLSPVGIAVEKYVVAEKAAGSGTPPERPLPTQDGQALFCSASSAPCTPANALKVESSGSRYYYLPLAQMPKFGPDALIAIEDRRFWTNQAFDLRSAGRAAKVDSNALIGLIASGVINPSQAELQGGSTLENQLVGESVTQPFPGDPIEENIYNDIIGQRMLDARGKKSILEDDMNRLPLARETTGVGSASMALFNIPAQQLTVEQGTKAQLGPARYKVKIGNMEKWIEIVQMATGARYQDVHFPNYNDPASQVHIYNEMVNVRTRFDDVLPLIERAGVISAEDDKALLADMDSRFTFAPNDPDHKEAPTGFIRSKLPFVPDKVAPAIDDHNAAAMGAQAYDDLVDQEARTDLGLQPDQPLPAGKYYTTLDPIDQRALEAATNNRDDPTVRTIMDSPTLNYGITSMRPDGSVAAMKGSKDYSQFPENLAEGAQDGGSGRTAGSILKTFYVAGGIEDGMDLTDRLYIPKEITYDDPRPGIAPWPIVSGQGCEFLPKPHNHAPCVLTLAEAEADSSDMMPVEITRRVGMKRMLQYLQDLGLPVNQNTPPQVMLGVGQFSPEQIARAYSTLLNAGKKVVDYVINKIVSPTGVNLYQHQQPSNPEQIFSQTTATSTLQALKDTPKFGTLRGIFSLPDGPRSVGGKTGTTGTPGKGTGPSDLWTSVVACDPKRGFRTVVMWVGNPKGITPVDGLTTSGTLGLVDNDYLTRTMNSGIACDVAAPASAN